MPKTLNKKELYWLIGSLFIIVISAYACMGSNFAKTSETIAINIHDTFFVIANFYISLLIATVVLFPIYGLRSLLGRFKQSIPNIILLISNILLIFMFTMILSLIDHIRISPGTTEYPPLSSQPVQHVGNIWDSIYYGILFIQICLVFFLAFSAYMIGKNNRR